MARSRVSIGELASSYMVFMQELESGIYLRETNPEEGCGVRSEHPMEWNGMQPSLKQKVRKCKNSMFLIPRGGYSMVMLVIRCLDLIHFVLGWESHLETNFACMRDESGVDEDIDAESADSAEWEGTLNRHKR